MFERQLTIPLKEVSLNFRNFYHDSLHAQRFQTLIKSLVESIWVSNLIGGLSKGRESFFVNFTFLRHETTKSGPQRFMVENSEVSLPPLLAILPISLILVIVDCAKMADQGRSDLGVVFTMILCVTNFLSEAHIHKLASNRF